jgi:hypothetical protein
MQVWYGGWDRQRVALLGAGDETDLFRHGNDVWQWSSSDGVALHSTLGGRLTDALHREPPESLTTGALADEALTSMNTDTDMGLANEVEVADRPAYDLVLTPHNKATKIGSVHIAIDGATKVPLGVQIYPKGSTTAAIDVAFTSIRFGQPAARNFEFVPPPTASITELGQRLTSTPVRGAQLADVAGAGWTTVYRIAGGPKVKSSGSTNAAFRNMPTVSGHWGKGRLVESGLLSVLVTKDGRVFAGAVQPARLYAVAAAGARK